MSKPFFEALLALFAREAGAERERTIVLAIDNAGWHTEPGLAAPDGIRLVYLPPYSPELQPAGCLWPALDEPLASRHFATLAEVDAAFARRWLALGAEPDLVRGRTGFHWCRSPSCRADPPEIVSGVAAIRNSLDQNS